ncbi:MAG: hypothetical protein ABIQ95_03920 [Bdellovibrionia bacterium]
MSQAISNMGMASLIKLGILSVSLAFLPLTYSIEARAAEPEAAVPEVSTAKEGTAVPTESKAEAKKKAEEARLAKSESEEEVRLSMLNQLQVRETDRKKSDRLEEAELGKRVGGPVQEVSLSSKDLEVSRDGVEGMCGSLLDYMGKVEILDSTRSHILESKPNILFPCGSWISVRSGWGQIKFRDGQKVRLGADTLVQIQSEKDQLILFRGVTYVETSAGNGEFRLSTSIGRARINRGKIVFLYSPESDITQLISLENSATLENRFESERRVEVQPGESSELNFKQLRVIPLLPSSVASASLKKILDQLGVPDSDKVQAIRIATNRQEKKFAILRKKEFPEKTDDVSSDETSGGGRGLASLSVVKQKEQDELAATNKPYLRHRSDPRYPKLEAQMISRMTGGVPSGGKLVNPRTRSQRGRQIASEVPEEEQVHSHRLLPSELSAKKKLINDLSKIKIE